ncbi:MAG TPA: ABC transporter permease, partial [Blastocatellia bacterium]
MRLLYSRLYGFVFKRRLERDMEEEILFHLRMRASLDASAGFGSAVASRNAIRRFGRIEAIKEACRDVRGGGMIEATLQDLRFAVRMLIKKPGFTIVALITLALGIGANTAIFSIVDAVLLKPLPYPESQNLIVIAKEDLSPPDFLDVQAHNSAFEQMAAFRSRSYNMTGGDRPELIDGADVTTNLFSLLRVEPILGRAFATDDGSRAVDRRVILSYDLWQRRFGSSKAIIGQSLPLDGQPFTVVGVMPPGFQFPEGAELWVSPRYVVPEHPLIPDTDPSADRGYHYFDDTIARLKPGITMPKARADLDLVTAEIIQQHPDSEMKTNHPALISLHEEGVGDIRPALLVIFGVVTLVFLVACVNVANLMLSRGVARRKELAIRTVLGASRGRVLRQLLTESVLLALIGGMLGVIAAFKGFSFLVLLTAKSLGQTSRPQIDGTVLAFTAGVSLLAALIFGLAPAFQGSRTELTESVKEGGRSSSVGRSRYQEILVTAEVALAVVLLVGAGLLLRSFMRLAEVATGFDANNVMTLGLSLPQSRYPKPESKTVFVDNILAKIRAVPGVTDASVISRLPLSSGSSTRGVQIEGRTYPPNNQAEPVSPDYGVISPGYFVTMHIPLLAGRDFTGHDDASNAKVAIVSKAAADTYWPNEDPVGRRMTIENGAVQVVGVVGDVRQHQIIRAIRPCVYVPYPQDPWPSFTVTAKTGIASDSLAGEMEQAIWTVDNDQ